VLSYFKEYGKTLIELSKEELDDYYQKAEKKEVFKNLFVGMLQSFSKT
jgi:ribosome biogenesis protein Tsr3